MQEIEGSEFACSTDTVSAGMSAAAKDYIVTDDRLSEKKHPGILIFGGTVEGRQVSEYLAKQKVAHTVCVATEYGVEASGAARTASARTHAASEESCTVGGTAGDVARANPSVRIHAASEESCAVGGTAVETGGADPIVTIHQGRMDAEQMRVLLKKGEYTLVVDATHPYAVEVSKNIREACGKENVPYLRYLRPPGNEEGQEIVLSVSDDAEGNRGSEETEGRYADSARLLKAGKEENCEPVCANFAKEKNCEPVCANFAKEKNCEPVCANFAKGKNCETVYVNSTKEAADYLERQQGGIFLTTGSKELHVFTETISDISRLFARVLPSAEVVASCRALGLEGRQICAMQGPFSTEINVAMLRQMGASFLVTKSTGASGGFPEKIEAARQCGVTAVIIRRPEESGYDWEEVKTRLDAWISSEAAGETQSETADEPLRIRTETQNQAGADRNLQLQKEKESEPSGQVQKEERTEKSETEQKEEQKEQPGQAQKEEQSKAPVQLSGKTPGRDGQSDGEAPGGDGQSDGEEQRNPAAKLRSDLVISCIGIGMGTPDTLTQEALREMREAQVLFGAKRILESAREALTDKSVSGGFMKEETLPEMVPEYSAAKIYDWLAAHPAYTKAAILMSGDVGFYSGARQVAESFPAGQVRYYCGISSVVYFASRIPTTWQDAKLLSAHGKELALLNYVKKYPKIILLVSGASDVERFCGELTEAGLGQVRVTVGTNLSYPEETIRSGAPQEFCSMDTTGLHILMIENPDAGGIITPGIPDEAFVRGKVPMTKEEIRALSVAKLRLREDSVVYDVGAGTGSVSIECARLCTEGNVFAIERNPEGIALIRENERKFALSNLTAVEGTAPEALCDLPTPTHAFIGGSSGNMREIIETLREKNPAVRVVINTVTMETIAEVMELIRELNIEDADIVQVSAAKSRPLGRYHMMTAHNPVYIIAFGGEDGLA